MNRNLFARFSEIAYDTAGICLNENKTALLQARIAKRMRTLDFRTPEEYLNFLETDESGDELVQFLDSISTNYTYFFREEDHFEIYSRFLAYWKKQGQTRFRIWCAAAATGEEPYSIAITTREALDVNSFDIKILATDISTKALNTAMAGAYSEEKLKNIDDDHRRRNFEKFTPESHRDDRAWRVKGSIRSLLTFKRLNLAEPPFPMTGPLDFVFCRNVMIYFDQYIRRNLINEIARLLKPGGILVIGHSENLRGIESGLVSLAPSVYQKAE